MSKVINIVNQNSISGRIRRTPLLTVGHGLKSVFAHALETLLVWQERSRQRNELMSLDARMLRDIGISRSEAEREYRKKFWQV